MDNKQSQLVMAQLHLIEAMLGALMETHHNKQALVEEFSKGREWFLNGVKKKGFSKDVIEVMDKRFGQMIEGLTRAPTQ